MSWWRWMVLNWYLRPVESCIQQDKVVFVHGSTETEDMCRNMILNVFCVSWRSNCESWDFMYLAVVTNLSLANKWYFCMCKLSFAHNMLWVTAAYCFQMFRGIVSIKVKISWWSTAQIYNFWFAVCSAMFRSLRKNRGAQVWTLCRVLWQWRKLLISVCWIYTKLLKPTSMRTYIKFSSALALTSRAACYQCNLDNLDHALVLIFRMRCKKPLKTGTHWRQSRIRHGWPCHFGPVYTVDKAERTFDIRATKITRFQQSWPPTTSRQIQLSRQCVWTGGKVKTLQILTKTI